MTRLNDWYVTTISQPLRITHLFNNYLEGMLIYEMDPTDVNTNELSAMRRRFDRVAVRYN